MLRHYEIWRRGRSGCCGFMAPSHRKDLGSYPLPEDEMVTLATYQLLGDAEYWWGNT
ncbi:hypothetical protein A2U01_0105455, partial [Trifolium medium]|nr:hypothetical protein [Trifolium medium]